MAPAYHFPRNITGLASALPALLAEPSAAQGIGFDVSVAGERLCVPNRTYAPVGLVRASISMPFGDAPVFAACLGTRHHNGYLREACLRRLAGTRQIWTYPFVVALLGDYVIEITEIASAAVKQMNPVALAALARDNPSFIATTKARAISYWDCYYRSRDYRRHFDYPAVLALEQVERLLVSQPPRASGFR